MKQFILFAATGLLLFACNKEEQNTSGQGPSAIVITLDTPNENAAFDFGEQVSISGSISSVNTIHGYTVKLINLSNQDSVLFLSEVHTHNKTVPFAEVWENNLSDTSSVAVEIIALGNHEGTVSETITRSIVCNGQ